MEFPNLNSASSIKNYLFYLIGPMLFIVLFDQLLKNYAIYFSNTAYCNRGIILGFFSDAPPIARIVFVTVLFGLFSMIGLGLYKFFIARHKKAAFFLCVYLGGVVSNSVDRIRYGGVIDHIVIPGINSLVWNSADFFEWVGAIFFLILIWKNHSIIWYEKNLRTFHFINRPFQKKFFMTLATFIFFIWFVLFLFYFTYFKFIYEIPHPKAFFLGSFSLLVFFEVVSFFITLWWSNKIVGPIQAFTRHIDAILTESPPVALKLRNSDELKELEVLAEKIEKKIRSQK